MEMTKDFIEEMKVQIYKRIELGNTTEEILEEMRDSFAEMFQESLNISKKEALIAGKKLTMDIWKEIGKEYNVEYEEVQKVSEKNPYKISKWQKGSSCGIEGYILLTDEQYNEMMNWRNQNLELYSKYELKKVSLSQYNNNKNLHLDGYLIV